MLGNMLRIWLAATLAVLFQAASAQELSIRGAYSGNFHDPARDGQGVQIEVVDPRRATVAWYTFGPAGDPVWLFGVGEIRGDTISVDLSSYDGGAFPAAPTTPPAAAQPWGRAEIRFSGCNGAEMSWTTSRGGFDDGSMELQRVSGIEGRRCGAAEAFQRTVDFSLDAGPGPWETVFADYPVGDDLDLQSQWTRLPEPLADRHGLMVAGNNSSDDLAMFFKAPVEGLEPDTRYRVELAMTFATAAPQDCLGVGGSPGGSVYVKLGAAGRELVQVTDVVSGRDYYRLNIDKGGQSQGGSDALVVGDMANFQENCPPIGERQWQLKTVSTGGRAFTATTDAEGTLWVYGGSDSAFEATTLYFVTDFTARLSPAGPES